MRHTLTSKHKNNYTKVINSIYVYILFILGIYFGKIRSELFDGADRLYEAIAFKNNYFGHYRFSTAINGIIPWIIAHIHNDPKWVLYGFMLNYALTPLIIFLILRYYFKDEYLVSFYLVSLSLFYTLVFFHPNHDILIGFYYMILLYAYIHKTNPDSKYYSLIIFFLFILLSFTHLTQIIPTVLLLLYAKVYQKNNFPFKRIFTLFLIAFLIKLLLFSSGYEEGIFFRIFEFKERLQTIFQSPLIITFFKSFYSINLTVTFILLITTYILLNKKEIKLLLIIIIHIFFTLFFITFFFQDYPYVFGTEGYLKGSSILLSIVFVDYFLYSQDFTQKRRITILTFSYLLTLIIILLNGINYTVYFNNTKYMSNNLTANTIYVSKDAKDLGQYFIVHRHSALMNLTENNKCFYFQYFKDSIDVNNQVFERDLKDKKLCFGENPIIITPDAETKRILDNQFSLIFDLTNLNKRVNFKEYIYTSGNNATNFK